MSNEASAPVNNILTPESPKQFTSSYFDVNDYVSQSTLKLWIANPALAGIIKYKELPPKVASVAQKVGSLVDHMLTETVPVYEKFTILPPFTENQQKVLEYLVANDLDINENTVFDATREMNLYATFKNKTNLFERYFDNEQFKTAYDDLKNIGDSTVVSADNFQTASLIVNSLVTNPYTSKWTSYVDTENINMWLQAEMYWEEVVDNEIIKIKGKPDYILINHETKTFKVADLKTTRMLVTTSNFSKTVLEYGYDTQAVVYVKGMEAISNGKGKLYVKGEEKDITGYKWDGTYYFIVETTDLQNIGRQPSVFLLPTKTFNNALYGNAELVIDDRGNRQVRILKYGYNDLLREYLAQDLRYQQTNQINRYTIQETALLESGGIPLYA